MDPERIAALRVEYETQGLDESDVDDDPFRQFERWFDEAALAGVDQANAFVLATADADGRPSARAVLMKDFSGSGLTFFTNLTSRKAGDLEANPAAAACFVWMAIRRQVRIEGAVELVEDDVADSYFVTRPPGARLAAAVSPQSQVVPARAELEERYAALQELHPEGDVDRPSTWGGYRIVPSSFEFWQGRPHRFHDRIRYRLEGPGWVHHRLAP